LVGIPPWHEITRLAGYIGTCSARIDDARRKAAFRAQSSPVQAATAGALFDADDHRPRPDEVLDAGHCQPAGHDVALDAASPCASST
jgi:hypothetical protein